MIKRRTMMVLTILAVGVLAVVILLRLIGSKGAEEGEEVATDVAVHVGRITRVTLHRSIMAYGTVEPEPPSQGRPAAHAHVGSPVAGVVAHVDCREGQKVDKGTVLFRLDSRLAEVAYLKAKKALEFAEANYGRQKKLIEVQGTSVKNFQEAEQQLNVARSELAGAETNLAVLSIQATLAGTVVKINTEPGEAVELYTVLATIIDLDRLIVSVNIPSHEAGAVKLGQPAQFGPGGSVSGLVLYVGAEIDPKSGTVLARVSVPAGAGLQPGQFLSVRIVCEEHANCLAVPEAGVVADTLGGETGVIVLVETDKAVRKNVKIGLREAGLVEVEGEGLKEGMTIVTQDAYAIPGETKVHIIN